MPNTLIEGMCSGLPIVCSNRGPMPEVLKDGGLYFNPEDSNSIAGALEKIIRNKELRSELKKRSFELSKSLQAGSCFANQFWK